MEPFALFNLLKTLLPQTENPQPQPPTEPNKPNPHTQEKTENLVQISPVQNNSFLDFAKRHDERAKRIKK